MLMLHGERAAGALRSALAEQAGVRRGPDGWLARALARFGTPGVGPLADWMDAAPGLQVVAVAVFRMLVEGLYLYRRCRLERTEPDLTETDFWLKVRGLTMPAVHPARVNGASLSRIGRLVAGALVDGPRRSRLDAGFAIGHFPDSVAFPVAEEALRSGDTRVASAVALSLGRRPTARRVEVLLTAAENGLPRVARSAGESLGSFWQECLSLTRKRLHREETARLAQEGLVPLLSETEELLQAFDASYDRIKACRGVGGLLGGSWERMSPAAFVDMVAEHVRDAEERKRAERDASELYRRGRAYHEEHPDFAVGRDAHFYLNLPAAVRAIPEDREYREKELNRLVGSANWDVALARRRLYEEGWMDRTGDRYRFTDRGRRAWRIEHLLADGAAPGAGPGPRR
jgi:hypothetical protein